MSILLGRIAPLLLCCFLIVASGCAHAEKARQFLGSRTVIEHDPEGMASADYRCVASELLERWSLAPRTVELDSAAVGGRRGNSEE